MRDQLLLVAAGAAVAIITQLLQAWRSDKSAAASEARAGARELNRSVQDIEDAAARQIEGLYSELVEAIRRIPDLPTEADTPNIDRRESLIAELRQRSLYLEKDLADRVRLLTDIARFVDELAPSRTSSGYHYHGRVTMMANCREEMHRQLSAHLRRLPAPPMSPIVSQYSLSLDQDFEDRRDEFYEEIAESERNQDQWIARDPETREPFRVVDEE